MLLKRRVDTLLREKHDSYRLQRGMMQDSQQHFQDSLCSERQRRQNLAVNNLIKKIKIVIELKLKNDHLKSSSLSKKVLQQTLRKCDCKDQESLERIEGRDRETKFKFFKRHASIQDGLVKLRSVKEAIQLRRKINMLKKI